MEMTLSLYKIADAWMQALQESTVIQNFCQEKYGKSPTFLMGTTPRQLPDEDNCPFILIMPGHKVEGIDEGTFSYILGIAWVIFNDKVAADGNIVPFDSYPNASLTDMLGMRECNSIGQLIYEELQACAESKGWPISHIDFDISPSEAIFPQWSGVLVATTNITPSMGEEIIY